MSGGEYAAKVGNGNRCDAAAIASDQIGREVEARPTYPYIHKALIELHRLSGLHTRLEDDGSAIELVKDAAYLAGVLVYAIESGRASLLVAPR